MAKSKQQQEKVPQDKKRKREVEEEVEEEEEDVEVNHNEENAETGEPAKKLTKREKKDQINEKKRARNPNFDSEVEAKRLWENLLQHVNKLSKGKKSGRPKDDKTVKMMTEIVELIKGNLKGYAVTHDMGRVIQTILKLGTHDHVMLIFEALKPELKNLCGNKFGHIIVMKLLTYVLEKGRFTDMKAFNKLRMEFFDALFKANMKYMIKQKYHAAVVDHAFRTIWTPAERILFLQEFYGSDFWFTNYEQTLSDTKSLHEVSLKQKLQEQPGKKSAVLHSLKEVASKIIEKDIFDLELPQKLIVDILENGDVGQVQNIVSDLSEKDALPFIFHTMYGCKISIFCVAYGAARDRKRIIKSLTQNTAQNEEESIVLKAAKTFYGSIFLRYILSVTDDTKKSKSLLKEIQKSLLEMISDNHAQKVVLSILNPQHKVCNSNNDAEFLNPELREDLLTRTGKDGSRVVSMRSKEDIMSELINFMAPVIGETIMNNIILLADEKAQPVVYEALVHPKVPNKNKLYEKIVQLLTNSQFDKLASDPTTSRTVSNIIRSQKLDQVSTTNPLLAKLVFEKLKGNLLEHIEKKSAGFILAAILSAGDNGGDKEISAELNKLLGQIYPKLKKQASAKSEGSVCFLTRVYERKNGIAVQERPKKQQQANKKKKSKKQ